jgi:hypothetical protein
MVNVKKCVSKCHFVINLHIMKIILKIMLCATVEILVNNNLKQLTLESYIFKYRFFYYLL